MTKGYSSAPWLNEDAEPAHLPLYLRIRRTIRSQIDSGAFTPGAAIPSESDLAQQYGTTKLTIRNTIDGLIDEGLLFRVQGKGTFVTHGLQANSPSRGPRGFRASQSDLQHHPSVRVLETSLRPAGAHYARLFEVSPESNLFQVRRLNRVDGEPFAIESALVPCELFPGIETIDVSLFSLYEFYALRGHEVVRAQEWLEACNLKPREAQLLRGSVDDPALGIRCVSYDANDRALEYVTSVAIGKYACYSVLQ